jgi:hypothetical protein
MGALIAHTCDEIMKGSAFLADVLTDPMMGSSDAPEHAPMMVCFHRVPEALQTDTFFLNSGCVQI